MHKKQWAEATKPLLHNLGFLKIMNSPVQDPVSIALVAMACIRADRVRDALGCTYSMPVERARELGLDHLFAIAATGSHPVIRIETLGAREVLIAPTGSWGDLSTQSFYPPHHITMGEGGVVNIISRGILKKYAESFRDWGRDCWCASGHDDTCHNRFGWKHSIP